MIGFIILLAFDVFLTGLVIFIDLKVQNSSTRKKDRRYILELNYWNKVRELEEPKRDA